jgi:hypothetical protein
MKRKVKISRGKIPIPKECPKCASKDLCIDNVEGMECMDCGCWFDTDSDGTVIWARLIRPVELDML